MLLLLTPGNTIGIKREMADTNRTGLQTVNNNCKRSQEINIISLHTLLIVYQFAENNSRVQNKLYKQQAEM